MDRADDCRRAARAAVADIEPPRLFEVITTTIDETSMVPGVLTLESALAIDPDSDVDSTGLTTQAAGVQLIYNGLRLTRRLAHDEPWQTDTQSVDADLEILAADILVARGFYLLARTDAAERAVATVQAFGRDQTRREQPGVDPTPIDANLERDVLELAVLTGTTAVGSQPPPHLLSVAASLADTVGTEFPPAGECLSPLEGPLPDGQPTDRVPSAGDP